MTDKYDGFRPRQGGSIDGFLSGPGQRPRQPQFRATNPPVAKPASLPQSQPTSRTMEPVAQTAPSVQPTTAPPLDGQPKQAMADVSTPTLSTPRSFGRRTGRAASDNARQSERRERSALRAAPELKSTEKNSKTKSKQAKAAKPKRGFKSIVKRTAKILGIILLIAVLFLGFKFYKNIANLTGNNNPFSLLGAFKPAHLDNENGRVNILVAGNSADDLGHGGAELTDSIMIMSVNTRNNTAMMISVPRDLWVDIPGVGHSKINAAYTNGGMDTLKGVIEDNLDLPIHYTVLVNYSAFRDLVNAVGGISITIDSPDPRGIYDSSLDWTTRNCCALAKYPNGPVTLNGKQALNLARARGEGYGSYGFPGTDFTRTENQRKMLFAIKDKASSTSVIANPFKVSSLVDAVGKNVKTDLQIDELQTLYYYMKKIPNDKIDSYNINSLKGENTTMLANYTAPGGQSALIPAAGIDNFTDIADQIQWLFTATPIQKEDALVVMLNGTDTVGLAHTQAVKLKKLGMSVPAESDAPANQQTTTIIDNSDGKKPNTLAELKKRYSATVVQNKQLVANYPSADFIVILGQNVAAQQQKAAQDSSN